MTPAWIDELMEFYLEYVLFQRSILSEIRLQKVKIQSEHFVGKNCVFADCHWGTSLKMSKFLDILLKTCAFKKIPIPLN